MSDNGEFIKSLTDATYRIVQETARQMETACLVIEADAKKNCPVDMGILRASLTHDVEVSDTEIIGRNGSLLEYAPYVHQGTGIYAVEGNGRKTPWGYKSLSGKYKGFHWTRGQKPRPFLKNAVINNKGKVERILGG